MTMTTPSKTRSGAPWARPRLTQDLPSPSSAQASASAAAHRHALHEQATTGGLRRPGPVAAVAVAAVVAALTLAPLLLFDLLPLADLLGSDGVLRAVGGRSIRPRLDPAAAYKGRPWTNERTVAKITLGETPFARCDVHSVRSEDGKTVVRDWIFFEERDAVNVVVQNSDGKFVVFRQRKYAIPGDALAPVGGFVEDGESPYDAARREVAEELGMGSRAEADRLAARMGGTEPGEEEEEKEEEEERRRRPPVVATVDGIPDGRVTDGDPDWVYLGAYRTAANRGGGFLYSYLLKGAVPLRKGGGTNAFRGSGDDESQRVMLFSREEVVALTSQGMFKEIKWAATFSLALLHLLNGAPGVKI